MPSRPFIRLRDVIILLLICAFGITIFVPTRRHLGDSAERSICSDNLRQIGSALLRYLDQNNGLLPRTRHDPALHTVNAYTNPNSPDPFSPTGPLPNDVTAAYFLLLRTQDLSPNVFVCPGTVCTPWDFGGNGKSAKDASNFPSPIHLSYSFLNPYPDAEALAQGYTLRAPLSPELAVAADMNPGVPELLTTPPTAPVDVIRTVNSFNHPNYNRDGQTVLFGDGHTDFVQNPFCGIDRDNIYTCAASEQHPQGIVGPPRAPNDSVLLPVATIDPETGRPLHGGTDRRGILLLIPAAILVAAAVLYVRVRKRHQPPAQ